MYMPDFKYIVTLCYQEGVGRQGIINLVCQTYDLHFSRMVTDPARVFLQTPHPVERSWSTKILTVPWHSRVDTAI